MNFIVFLLFHVWYYILLKVLWILTVIFSVSVIGLSFETAYAQSYNGYLVLDPPPLTANEGDEIIFSGILLYDDGTPIIGETINIKDNLSLK